MIRRLDHVGVLVGDTDNALEYFAGTLGLEVVHQEVVEAAAVRLTYLDAGNILLQLVEPLSDTSPLAGSSPRSGEGIHHLCFGVDDVSVEAATLGNSHTDVQLGQGRGRVSAFVPGAVHHGVRLECTEFDSASDVAQSTGTLPTVINPTSPLYSACYERLTRH